MGPVSYSHIRRHGCASWARILRLIFAATALCRLAGAGTWNLLSLCTSPILRWVVALINWHMRSQGHLNALTSVSGTLVHSQRDAERCEQYGEGG